MRCSWLCLALGLVTIAGCRGATSERQVADDTSERQLRSGTVVGFAGDYGSHTWLGIPYAQAPVEGLRWRAPRPPKPWQGRREALALGSPCVQIASPFGGVDGDEGDIVGSEDCLYLNVYAPRLSAEQLPRGGKALPVMVWIHGGGNTIGQGGFYNGGNLAVSQNVIVVTFNYRLGPFGWFRHAALRGEGTSADDRSGNFGTLDIVRALEWVHANASAFGGDPNRVTIFGESAGGVNVFSMLVSPKAKGLFHRAIVQSGGPWTDSAEAGENFADDTPAGHAYSSNELLLKMLIADDKAGDRAAAKAALTRMSPLQVHQYLHDQSGEKILGRYEEQFASGLIEMPKLFREGTVIPREEPMELFARGSGYNQVPVMIGTNRDENKLFMFADRELVRNYFGILPRLRDPEWYDLSAEYLAKMWRATGADQPATILSANGAPAVFNYRFDWDEEPTILGADLGEMLGAAHAFEIPFIFGHFDLGAEANQIFTEDNLAGREWLSQRMMSYWAEFAYSGDPGRGRDGELPQWPKWAGNTATFVVFDTDAGGGVRTTSGLLTKATVIAAVDNDPRLSDQRQRCRIFQALTTKSRALTPEEYVTAGRQGCAEYPLEGL
ncbi:MAG TPA: carboxylesterase family protein [Terriglobales bacterium]|nr:carboxylesterase family protein [Terriglobales bacterium]